MYNIFRSISCIALAFLSIFFSAQPSFCELNLATGQEENILVSEENEIKMGESLSKQVEQKMKLDSNYTNQERVAVIGQRLAEVSDRKHLIYHFKVLTEDTDNAFALPGGYVYVFKGLLEKMKSDDEVAAIMAHEMAHICAKHSLKRLQSSLGYQLLRILVSQGANDNYTRYRANEAINQLMVSYGRQDEFEADRLAVKYLKKAGYKPEAMVDALNVLLNSTMDGPERPKRYWYTHPYLAARIGEVRKEVTGEMDFDDYINVTEDEEYVIKR
jgi:predicted Zn-dependent protease